MVALVTPPSDEATLREFVRRTNPGGPGWQAVIDRAERAGAPIRPLHDTTNIPRGLLCTFLGTVAVYAGLFGSGMLLYGQMMTGTVTLVVGLAATVALFRVWQGMRLDTTRA